MCCCLSELVTVEDLERVQEVGHSLGMGSTGPPLCSRPRSAGMAAEAGQLRPAVGDGRGSSLNDILPSGLHTVLPQACDGAGEVSSDSLCASLSFCRHTDVLISLCWNRKLFHAVMMVTGGVRVQPPP